jgi:hypothetical protein
MNNEQMNAEIEKLETAIKGMNASIEILKGVIEGENKQEERKPLFSFDGKDYFMGDDIYFFRKANYQIVGNKVVNASSVICEELTQRSKIYPTKELCKEALNDYVWENYLLSAKELHAINDNFHSDNKLKRSWKIYFCEQIIKQKNNGN